MTQQRTFKERAKNWQSYTIGTKAEPKETRAEYCKRQGTEPGKDYQEAKETAKAILEAGAAETVYIQRWTGEELANEYELKAGLYTITTKSRGKGAEPREGYKDAQEVGRYRTYERAELEARAAIYELGHEVLFIQKWGENGEFITEYALRASPGLPAGQHKKILEKYRAEGDPNAEIMAELEEISLMNRNIEKREKRRQRKQKERKAAQERPTGNQ